MRNIVLTGAVALLSLPAGLAIGQTLPEPQQLSETYGAWTVRCQSRAAESTALEPECEVFQQRIQNETGQMVASVAYRILPEDQAIAVVFAPFGLRLSEGVRVESADETLWSGEFQTCVPSGCISVPQLDLEQMNAVLEADTAQLTFVSNEGQKMNIAIDTSGFPDAWQRLKTLVGKS